jgi:hypothetical protein
LASFSSLSGSYARLAATFWQAGGRMELYMGEITSFLQEIG